MATFRFRSPTQTAPEPQRAQRKEQEPPLVRASQSCNKIPIIIVGQPLRLMERRCPPFAVVHRVVMDGRHASDRRPDGTTSRLTPKGGRRGPPRSEMRLAWTRGTLHRLFLKVRGGRRHSYSLVLFCFCFYSILYSLVLKRNRAPRDLRALVPVTTCRYCTQA